MSKRRHYVVEVERDEEGWWVASVPEVAGVHTQGRTLAQARERVREALSAATGVDDSAIVMNENLRLDDAIKGRLDEAMSARMDAERLQRLAQKAVRAAAVDFTRRGMSTRDTGDLLQMSHQRVHQLLHSKAGSEKVSWVAGRKAKNK